MRGYPQFSFWISITLVKIYIPCVIINRGKNTIELVGTVLKPLNFFVQKYHFKMENIYSTINYVSPGDYMVSLDFKDAYFSVPIHPLDWKLLRFFWKGQRFEFTCLPFGYSLAPTVFTKILKPFAATWRSEGIRISIYIDDILINK